MGSLNKLIMLILVIECFKVFIKGLLRLFMVSSVFKFVDIVKVYVQSKILFIIVQFICKLKEFENVLLFGQYGQFSLNKFVVNFIVIDMYIIV